MDIGPLPTAHNFKTAFTTKDDLEENDIYPQVSRLYWTKDASKRFIEGLKCDESKPIFENIWNMVDANAMVTDLNEAFKLVAIKREIKVSKIRKHFNKNPWYDRECSNSKKKIAREAGLIKKDPDNNNSTVYLYELKRKYKNMIKAKKKKYHLGIFIYSLPSTTVNICLQYCLNGIWYN